MEKEKKLFIHIKDNEILLYLFQENVLTETHKNIIVLEDTSFTQKYLETIDATLEWSKQFIHSFDNYHVRVFATGFCQNFSDEEQEKMKIHIFVQHGVQLNILKEDLEKFYSDKSLSVYGFKNIVYGMMNQEFRKVVICGSFQQNLKEIGNIFNKLTEKGIEVLSPWTTKVVPSTLGTDFILLDGQVLVNKRDSWRHKYEHMSKFKSADAIIICNPAGIIGQGTMFEFGFMVASSKRIIFLEKPKNLSILFPYEVGINFIE